MHPGDVTYPQLRPSPTPRGLCSKPPTSLLFCSVTVNALVCHFSLNYIFIWDLLCVKHGGAVELVSLVCSIERVLHNTQVLSIFTLPLFYFLFWITGIEADLTDFSLSICSKLLLTAYTWYAAEYIFFKNFDSNSICFSRSCIVRDIFLDGGKIFIQEVLHGVSSLEKIWNEQSWSWWLFSNSVTVFHMKCFFT